jgi:16S rRNA (cytosine1402-N4)-methyltransferase
MTNVTVYRGPVGGRNKRRERLGLPESSGRERIEVSPFAPIPEWLHLKRFIQDHSIDHVPVLFEPVLQSLAGLENEAPVILDGTLGEAGHTRGMLRLRPDATVIALDRDEQMLERAKQRLSVDGFRLSERPDRGAVCLFHAPFSEAASLLAEKGLAVDFLLCDFGVAMFHFSQAGRGFSFRDSDLDMRLDSRLGQTAADLLNKLPEEELARIFFEYGEERQSRPIARSIVEARPIVSASQLTDCVLSVLIRRRDRSGRREFIRDSDAARVFQALRIAVNGEIEQIEALVESIPAILNPGGRAALISFHSLEDRPVKKGFQSLASQGFRILTKKAIAPDEEELKINPAARSAKLRVIERLRATEP